MIIPSESYYVPSEGGSLEIQLRSNFDFKVYTDVDWITQAATKSLSNRTLNFSISRNNTGNDRSGKIVLRGKMDEKLYVYQRRLSFDSAYVTRFTLHDRLAKEIHIGESYIDTVAHVVVGYVAHGQDVSNIYPRISLCTYAKISPSVHTCLDWTGALMKDDRLRFQPGDWTPDGNPTPALGRRVVAEKYNWPMGAMKFTVFADNRKISKEYTFVLVERPAM